MFSKYCHSLTHSKFRALALRINDSRDANERLPLVATLLDIIRHLLQTFLADRYMHGCVKFFTQSVRHPPFSL